MFTAGCRPLSQLGNTRQQTPGLLGFCVVSCRNVPWGGLCWVNQPGTLLNPWVKAHVSWREPRGRAHSSGPEFLQTLHPFQGSAFRG